MSLVTAAAPPGHPAPAGHQSPTEGDFTFFADFLRRRSAISLAPGKEYLMEARLTPIAARAGFAGVRDLVTALRAPGVSRQLVDQVVDAMTTNETSFFRDVSSFEALRTVVVPQLLAARAGQRRLSVWSAASSTGQELYTIAMTLEDSFPQLSGWDVKLVGTDLSTEAVARARAGRFSHLEVNRGLPAHLLVKYFEREGRDYVVAPRLRERTRFDRMNLAEPWTALPRFDIVFCRNVLIYFDPPVREQILAKIRGLLNPGGFLFLGPGETSASVIHGYTQVRAAGTVVHQLQGAAT